MLDYIFMSCSSEEWAGLLKVPLERAAGDGDKGLVRRLVQAGAQMGREQHSSTVRGGRREVVSILYWKTEHPSTLAILSTSPRRSSPLHIAASPGNAEMAESLLLRGADKDAWDGRWNTAVYIAAHFGHLTAAQALWAAGADVEFRYGRLGKMALHAAAWKGQCGDHASAARGGGGRS